MEGEIGHNNDLFISVHSMLNIVFLYIMMKNKNKNKTKTSIPRSHLQQKNQQIIQKNLWMNMSKPKH